MFRTKPAILTIALLLVSLMTYAQHHISGVVKDINNQPLQKVSISLKGQKHSAFTDATGTFHIDNVPPGIFTIHFSHTGYQGQDAKFNTDTPTPVDVVLLPSLEQLQTVEITGRKEMGYKNTNSFIGTKTATPLKDVPASISYVTKELIQDQAAVRIGDVVKNMSGVNQFTFYDDLTIRGFRINGGSTTQLMNGMRTFTGFWKQPMVNFLERVEVIKGPASALFGNASPGGVINRVTKKPLDEDRKSLSFSMGSFNTTRALLDFTGPLNEDKTILYRLNIGYENAESFRTLQFDKNIVIAPSVSFLPTAKTRINFDAVYNKSNSRLDRGQSIFLGQSLYSTPISQSLSATNDYLNEETYTVMASLNHQFSDRLAFNLSYLRTGYTEDLLEHRSANGYAVDSFGHELSSLIARQVFVRKKNPASANASAYLTYDANTGKIGHKLLLGYDYSQATLSAGASQMTATNYQLKSGGVAAYDPKKSANYVFYKYITPAGDTINIPKPNVPSYDLLKRNNNLEDMNKYIYAAQNAAVQPTFNSLGGIYLQDQVKFGAWQVLLGVRYETYTDRRYYKTDSVMKIQQHAFLPRLGIVYTVTRNINVYGVYTRGYNPQDAATQSNPLTGGPFDPIESELVEGGVKTEWLDGKLSGNLSVYNIIQKNTLYPAGVAGQPDLLTQVGKETAKGVELDLTGQITKDWTIVANYAYNDAVISNALGDDKVLMNRQKPNAPKHQGNLWTKYTLPQGKLKGLGLALGGNFVDYRTVSLNTEQLLPGYAIFNAALYYKVNRVQLQVNFNNLTNKTYWVGGYDYLRLFPGAPRNWMSTISYTF